MFTHDSRHLTPQSFILIGFIWTVVETRAAFLSSLARALLLVTPLELIFSEAEARYVSYPIILSSASFSRRSIEISSVSAAGDSLSRLSYVIIVISLISDTLAISETR